MPIRHAYLIEDNPTIRSNLIPTLSEMADVQVIGMAEGEHEAMDWLIQFSNQADFITLDLFLAEGGQDWVCCDRWPCTTSKSRSWC